MSLEVADLFATLGLKPKTGEWEHGEKLIEGVHKGLEAFAGYEAVKQISEMVDKTMEAAVGAERLGQKLGLTTDAVQELGYAADITGSSTDSMRIGLQFLARGLEETRTKGTGPAAEAFQKLGISIGQLKGKSLDQNLESIADRFQKLPDGAEKASIAMDLFGRQGTELIPLLDKGSAGIVELRAEAEKLGVVIGEDGVKKADQYEEAQKRLSATWTGLRNTVVVGLLPALTALVEKIQEWIASNHDAIVSGLTAAVQILMTAFSALGAVIQVVASVIEFFQQHSELAQAALIALGVVLGALAVEAAAAWLAAAAPVVGVVAAIAGVILVIKHLDQIVAVMRGAIGSALHWIWERFKDLKDNVVGVFESIGSFFSDIASSVRNAFELVIDWITEKIDWAWDQVKKIGHYASHPWQIPGAVIDSITGSGDDDGPTGPLGPQGVVRDPVSGGSNIQVDARSTMTINANGTDPQGVADIAKKEIEAHHDRTWRDISAATGADDDVNP